MSAKSRALAAALTLFALAAGAQQAAVLAHRNGILITDGYARAQGVLARTGAAFMAITNETATDDRLLAITSDAAERVELHAHVMDNGVARMRPVGEGVPLPAGQTVMLERGGLHVMFIGLTAPFETGTTVEATLLLRNAGPISIAIPVDPDRGSGAEMHHSGG